MFGAKGVLQLGVTDIRPQQELIKGGLMLIRSYEDFCPFWGLVEALRVAIGSQGRAIIIGTGKKLHTIVVP